MSDFFDLRVNVTDRAGRLDYNRGTVIKVVIFIEGKEVFIKKVLAKKVLKFEPNENKLHIRKSVTDKI